MNSSDVQMMSSQDAPGSAGLAPDNIASSLPSKKKSRRGADPTNQKRRCVSTACIACRRRKSKCDGALPSCAACASVYGTECIYDPNSDHRRKGVYREKNDSMKAQNATLQILIEAILNASEEDVLDIVRRIRTCDDLDEVAESIRRDEKNATATNDNDDSDEPIQAGRDDATSQAVEGERDLARKMGELRIENGSVRFIGGTSHLIYLSEPTDASEEPELETRLSTCDEDPITTWTEVTKNPQLIIHLVNMYFNWHYPYFTTLSRSLFYRDFIKGKPAGQPRSTVYCSSLLVNAMLALGCHFTSVDGAFAVPGDSRTKGDHFFAEAKRLIVQNDEYEKPRLTTVQALALMSVREAGCGREAKGWVYSGMSFRMAQDIGLNLDIGSLDEKEVDARRITFWGCFVFDKCWSNYLGRLPQLPKNTYNVPKYDVFPDEDAEPWSPYTDAGFDQSCKQPSRTRAIGLQLSKLCEISSDLLLFFYHPSHIGRSSGKSAELKKLSELHRRLEDWRTELPKEFEPKDGQLPNVILMHMFYHLQYIHLFRPFLKYTKEASPLEKVQPRRICTTNANSISKLMRLYKKLYNLRQICNIAVYMLHSACTIHMLNLPEKTARRDITHGVRQLEEMAEDWPCARRTLGIISVLARKWNVELPEEAAIVLKRTDEKYGMFSTSEVPSPNRTAPSLAPSSPAPPYSPEASLLFSTTAAAGLEQQPYSPMTLYSHPTPPHLAPESISDPGMSPNMVTFSDLPGPSAPIIPQQQQNMQAISSLSQNNMLHQHHHHHLQNQHQPQPPYHNHMTYQQQQHNLLTHPVSASSMSMSDTLATITAWGIPTSSPGNNNNNNIVSQHPHHQKQPQQQQQPQRQRYPTVGSIGTNTVKPPATATQTFTPAQLHANNLATATRSTASNHNSSKSVGRHVSPSSIYAIDGQDWYLKDGVTWQQGFQGWDLEGGGAGTATSTGGIGDGGRPAGGAGDSMARLAPRGNITGGGGGGSTGQQRQQQQQQEANMFAYHHGEERGGDGIESTGMGMTTAGDGGGAFDPIGGSGLLDDLVGLEGLGSLDGLGHLPGLD
ncbi:nitrogen assimilation transcription factor nit-4 [Neurospora hispaniola]|uniref:Nitrogen assimilation transcription factor nit-4 n=1 Tax=Neurospora hispaniola TaxID=588809 RepID=A0AAJ0I1W3_9PEZI|nr:nitrogen assimilation transcription factor nit-4 [Neurospora hispaniola]